jgi:FtsP/CotA-like multicopper oxidase with cupredoxin domain
MERRTFLKIAGGGVLGASVPALAHESMPAATGPAPAHGPAADHTLRIATGVVEVGPQRFLSMTTYNGSFPGPLIRLKEGRQVTVDIFNDTDTPEQLHWHGQRLPVSVDGAAEEGTPYIAAHGMRRVTYMPGPSGLRFYHTHLRAGSDLHLGQFSGQVGPVYIEPQQPEALAYDREVFLTLKEFEPFFSRGGDMAMDILSPNTVDPELKKKGEDAMQASMAKGMKKGFEVGYRIFTINGRQLGFGEPIRVKRGERILLHVLNGSATENRSLALPGHVFKVIALDGNPVPKQAEVPVLWLGTAERISAIVEMNHPGVWVLGDLADDDRRDGMGIVIEYAGAKGKPAWRKPAPFRWDYRRFADPKRKIPPPDQTIDMLFEKDNAAEDGFNRWTINGKAFDMSHMTTDWRLHRGKRYRLRMRNASDDLHPMHLHRHTFELTNIAGQPIAGVMKDVAMLGGYQTMEVDFTADQPGLTLFHCHMQLHMDFGFMGLFETT